MVLVSALDKARNKNLDYTTLTFNAQNSALNKHFWPPVTRRFCRPNLRVYDYGLTIWLHTSILTINIIRVWEPCPKHNLQTPIHRFTFHCNHIVWEIENVKCVWSLTSAYPGAPNGFWSWRSNLITVSQLLQLAVIAFLKNHWTHYCKSFVFDVFRAICSDSLLHCANWVHGSCDLQDEYRSG